MNSQPKLIPVIWDRLNCRSVNFIIVIQGRVMKTRSLGCSSWHRWRRSGSHSSSGATVADRELPRVHRERWMAAELARSKSVGLLRVGHDAADVWEALTQAEEHCRAQSNPAEYLGQHAAAVRSEGSDVVHKTASDVYQSQWGHFEHLLS